jgi:hypothetical protein
VSDPPDLDGVRHEYVNAGGLRAHVALAGPEDASPIVLVHGLSQAGFRGGFESRTICPRDRRPSADATTPEVPR